MFLTTMAAAIYRVGHEGGYPIGRSTERPLRVAGHAKNRRKEPVAGLPASLDACPALSDELRAHVEMMGENA
jgi:hypothetical protein